MEIFKEWFSENKEFSKRMIFNLIDGSCLDSSINFYKKPPDNAITIDKIVGIESIKIPIEHVSIPGEIFQFLRIEKDIKEGYAQGIISETELSNLLNEKILKNLDKYKHENR